MTLTQTAPSQPRGRKRRLADGLVLAAMAISAVALAVGLILQLGVTFWLAVSTAVLAFLCLLTVHGYMRRTDRIEELASEVERLEGELARLSGGRGQEPSLAPVRAAPSGARGQPADRPMAVPPRPAPSPRTATDEAEKGGSGKPVRPLSEAAPAAPPPISSAPIAPPIGGQQTMSPEGIATGDPSRPGVEPRTSPDHLAPAAAASSLSIDPGAHKKPQGPSAPTASERTMPVPPRGGWHPAPTVPVAAASAPPSDAGPVPPGADRTTERGAPGQPAPREVDVEMIQGLIKKLADEVNAVGVAEPPPARPVPPEQAIEASLSALRHTADAMRAKPADSPSAVVPERTGSKPLETDVDALLSRAERIAGGVTPPPQPVPAHPRPTAAEGTSARGGPPRELPAIGPPPVPDLAATAWRAPPRPPAALKEPSLTPPPALPSQPPARPVVAAGGPLAEVSEAIAEGRVDVLLEPILGLEDQRAMHYEVSLQLRGRSGAPVELGGLRSKLAGSGLLPLLDSLTIRRTSNVARRLDERGKAGSVFSTLSAESLSTDRFLADFADTYHAHERAAGQLVLTFSQADVRGFGTQEWATLADMRELGFRFALRAVTDLDMDFDALREAGFTFTKLDASVFLEGLPAPGGRVPASDICRHLAALGMSLIVEHIDDEAALARIFGFGVLLGQGQLFGGPRIVKAELAGIARTVAA